MNHRSTHRLAPWPTRCVALCLAFWLSLWLGACASPPTPPPAPDLFADDLFDAPSEAPDAEAIFALSDEMKRYVETDIAGQLRAKGPQRGLLEALYSKNQLKLEYDSVRTRNAAEAFEARSGNCLSLVIMTAAFARHLGLPVRYQSVYVDASWTRSGSLYFSSGHVNLALERRAVDARWGIDTDRAWTVDFLPADEVRGQRTRVIAEHTIVAMYMNNRAAEWLAQGRLAEAHAWAREAVRQSPGYLSAYNTLAVIYRQHGQLPHAARLLQHVLDREPENTVALSNLTRVLGEQGRHEDAALVAGRLARIEPHPPFHFFDQGMAALQAGQFATARDLFRRELQRAAYHHEFHFWLAVASLGLGDSTQARKHLMMARDHSTTAQDRALYSAKLERMRSRRLQ